MDLFSTDFGPEIKEKKEARGIVTDLSKRLSALELFIIIITILLLLLQLLLLLLLLSLLILLLRRLLLGHSRSNVPSSFVANILSWMRLCTLSRLNSTPEREMEMKY